MCAGEKVGTRRAHHLAVECCLVAFALFVEVPSTLAQEIDCNAQFYPGHVLVRFKATTTAGAEQTAHAAVAAATGGGVQVLAEYHAVQGLQLVAVSTGQEQAAIAVYQNDAGVEYAEPDYLLRLDQTVPDYPDFEKAWGLHNTGQTIYIPDSNCPPTNLCPDPGALDADIDAPQAWALWTGDPAFRIAVIDRGVKYDHPDLVNNIWTNPKECPGGFGTCQPGDVNSDGYPGVHGQDDDGDLKVDEDSSGLQPGEPGYSNDLVADDDENGYVDDFHGYDFSIFADNDPMEVDSNHGTPVAGIIAADGCNGIGAVGVNWRAKIVALKIFPISECGPVSSAVAAVQYCIVNDIKVSNNSWGGAEFCESHYNVIESARGHGHIFVASAGNSGSDNDTTHHYPACYGHDHTRQPGNIPVTGLENVIAVAATDNDDNVRQSSNFGKMSVDLAAPGVNVWTTGRPLIEPYTYFSATSAAAPFVTGVVALVYSRFENQQGWDWLRIKNRVLSTVRKVDALRLTGPKPVATGGVVNAYRALFYDCNSNGIDDACDINCNNPGCSPPCGGSLDVKTSESDCCVAHDTPDCSNEAIRDCVCGPPNAYDYCCLDGWDANCAEIAATCGSPLCRNVSDTLPDECAVPPMPGDILWNSDPLSPDRTTRSLRFRVQPPVGATGSPNQSAIKVTMVDLQHPIPANLPQYPPPNLTTFDTRLNGVCVGGSHAGHHCDSNADCRLCQGGLRDRKQCSSGAECVGPPNGTCPPAGPTCGTMTTCTAAGETNGCARWLGKLGIFREAQDSPPAGTYKAARLQCTPYYTDWVAETTSAPIAVVGAEIAPSSEYSVQMYGASCTGVEGGCTNVSVPVTMFTRRSGDMEAPFNPPGTTTQPDVTDIAQLVNKFKNVPGALVKSISQLQPNLPELSRTRCLLPNAYCLDGSLAFGYT